MSSIVVKANILVIGSGLAGLLASIDLCKRGFAVTLVAKGALSQSNSSCAQGGVAALNGQSNHSELGDLNDSLEQHLIDTIKSGAGLTDPLVAAEIINYGPRLIEHLTSLGVDFDRLPSGLFEKALEGGHAHPRVLHVKDATGKAITEALIDSLRNMEKSAAGRLGIVENAFVRQLLVNAGRCVGALVSLGADEALVKYSADAVVLATGGSGQVFARTTNPLLATGDGMALAMRAGALLADLEMVQFHPTALALENAPSILISEAVRGQGAVLRDDCGHRFAQDFHPDGELATRDVVARAIHSTMMGRKIDHVDLDFSSIGADDIAARFPNIVRDCRRYGIDPLVQSVPVAPAAHYGMGGVWTDVWGQTTVTGLFAIGECASNGLHGANRLASNSLLEAGCMAMKVADSLQHLFINNFCSIATQQLFSSNKNSDDSLIVYLPDSVARMRSIMYENAGLVRTESSLNVALKLLKEESKVARLSELSDEEVVSANLRLVSELIVVSALERKESRGAHYRSDYPVVDNEDFAVRLTVSGIDSHYKLGRLDVRSTQTFVERQFAMVANVA
ncbi:MAG: L-aspartate oxidase [Candidatus Obscuribacterales bacterium]|nr:L-aspartate oxidase [Candidatus Obscuribacterales bacterium]